MMNCYSCLYIYGGTRTSARWNRETNKNRETVKLYSLQKVNIANIMIIENIYTKKVIKIMLNVNSNFFSVLKLFVERPVGTDENIDVLPTTSPP